MGKKKDKSSSESSLCKLKKDDILKENIAAYMERVRGARYLCRKCGRAANRSDYLCKATEL